MEQGPTRSETFAMSRDDYSLTETSVSEDITWPQPADVLYLLLALRLCDSPEQRMPIRMDSAQWNLDNMPAAKYAITSTSTGLEFSTIQDQKPVGQRSEQNDGET